MFKNVYGRGMSSLDMQYCNDDNKLVGNTLRPHDIVIWATQCSEFTISLAAFF